MQVYLEVFRAHVHMETGAVLIAMHPSPGLTMALASTVPQEHISCAAKHFGVFSITTTRHYRCFPAQICQNTNAEDEALPPVCLRISLADTRAPWMRAAPMRLESTFVFSEILTALTARLYNVLFRDDHNFSASILIKISIL
jgi:hypothetical protein